MKGLFNDEIISREVTIPVKDRALQYGDGLFETIAIKDGKPKYLPYHHERLAKGGKLLGLNTPTIDTIQDGINILCRENELSAATIKLMVWRKSSNSRGYSFDRSDCNVLLICKPISTTSNIIERADFAQHIHFQYSPLSGIKTLNALPYILASREQQDRQLDELIVLNNDGYVCECVSSNLFWIEGGRLYTPPTTTGCLDGVARRVLMERFKKMGQPVAEKLVKPTELIEADAIFTTNSSGVRFVSSIANHHFDTALASDEVYII